MENIGLLIIGGLVILFFLVVIGGCVIWIIWGLIHHFNERSRDRERHQQYLLDEERREQREILEAKRDRESTAQEFKEIIRVFANLIADASSPWDEMVRTANALHGGSGSVSLKQMVENDVERILVAFSVANGSASDGLGRLYHAILTKPDEPLTVKNCIKKIGNRDHEAVELPGVIEPLSVFDSARDTHWATAAANAYESLVIRASESCAASVAVDTLRTKYFTLLQPYISADQFKNGTRSSSGSQNENQSGSQFNGNCPKCAKYFPVLRLKPDAGAREAKAAYRNFVKIYHPDRLEGTREQQTAQEELKQVNEAYRHIVGHFEPVRS